MVDDTKKKEKIAKVQIEKGISKDEAKKEVARRTIQEITGESAETNSKKVQDTLQIFDALLRGNLGEIIKEKKDIRPEDIRALHEHMLKNPAILDELASIGYGSDQLNVNAGMLKDRFDEVIKDIDKNGDAQQQEKTEEEKAKSEKETAKNNADNQLYPPPEIPKMEDPTNVRNDLGMASSDGKNLLDQNGNPDWEKVAKDTAKLALDATKGAKKVEDAIAKTAGKVVGKVAGDMVEKGTTKVLGNNLVGKTVGKMANKATGKAAEIATVAATKKMISGGLGG